MARRLVWVLVGLWLPTLAAAAPFTLECPDDSFDRPYHMTLDVEAKSAFFRSSGGTPIWGKITSSEGGRIFITLPRGYNQRDYELVWDESRKTLTWLDDPGDPSRRHAESRCEISKAP
ncbi:MAG: hypothetical protein WCE79_11725 [Xanthobacteraceae bacterium]